MTVCSAVQRAATAPRSVLIETSDPVADAVDDPLAADELRVLQGQRGMRHVRPDMDGMAGPQDAHLAVQRQADLAFEHDDDLLVRVRMGLCTFASPDPEDSD